MKKVTLIQNLVKLKKKITTDHYYDRYITTQDFNTLMGRKFYCKVSKSKFEKQKLYIANFVKKDKFKLKWIKWVITKM